MVVNNLEVNKPYGQAEAIDLLVRATGQAMAEKLGEKVDVDALQALLNREFPSDYQKEKALAGINQYRKQQGWSVIMLGE